MKRMALFTLATILLLVGASRLDAAPTPDAPGETTARTGKSIYSTRKNPPALHQESLPVAPIPTTDFPSEIRRTPQPPQTNSVPTLVWTTEPDDSFVVRTPSPRERRTPSREVFVRDTMAGEMVIDDLQREQVQTGSDQPFMGIDIPEARTRVPQTTTRSNPGPLVFSSPKNVTTKTEEPQSVDRFHARLAKIQLEKHNLDETLILIDKIRSSAFKVETLVDLAEYVSRDSHYKAEADRLYSLAVEGIEALAQGKPIVVKGTKTTTPLVPVDRPKPPTSVLIEEVKPVPQPRKTESVERKPLILEEEKPEPKAPTEPSRKRPTLTLSEDAAPAESESITPPLPETTPEKKSEPPRAEPPKMEAPKPEAKTEEKPKLTPPSRPTLAPPAPTRTLDEPKNEAPKIEEKSPALPPPTSAPTRTPDELEELGKSISEQAPKMDFPRTSPKAAPSTRRPLILPSEDDEDLSKAAPPAVTPAPQSNASSKAEELKTEEPKPAPATATEQGTAGENAAKKTEPAPTRTQRRPLPKKKSSVQLEEN